MLLSENDEDFELGKTILEGLKIKPSVLLNRNSKGAVKSHFTFKMEAGELKRYSYWTTPYYLAVDAMDNIIETK